VDQDAVEEVVVAQHRRHRRAAVHCHSVAVHSFSGRLDHGSDGFLFCGRLPEGDGLCLHRLRHIDLSN
jgi:hypothetical protein